MIPVVFRYKGYRFFFHCKDKDMKKRLQKLWKAIRLVLLSAVLGIVCIAGFVPLSAQCREELTETAMWRSMSAL